MIVLDARREALLQQLFLDAISVGEFEAMFPLGPGEIAVLPSRLVREGVETRDSDKLCYGLTFGHRFGFGDITLEFLHSLLGEDWHQLHELVVDAVLKFADPRSVDVLWSLAKTPLAYRTWDDVESLEVKCTYGLWKLETEAGVARLADLAASGGSRTRRVAASLLRNLARNPTAEAVQSAAISALSAMGLPIEVNEDDEELD